MSGVLTFGGLRVVNFGEHFVGKNISAIITLQNEDGTPVDLTLYTAFGKVVDENDTLILDLSPTVGGSNGRWIADTLIPANTVPGNYRWKGGVIDGSANEYGLFHGRVNFVVY